ncbi:hypothetical protein pb186bvf_020114 [Paramecium bursaria]
MFINIDSLQTRNEADKSIIYNLINKIDSLQNYEHIVEPQLEFIQLKEGTYDVGEYVYINLEGITQSIKPSIITNNFRVHQIASFIRFKKDVINQIEEIKSQHQREIKINFFCRSGFFSSLSLRQLRSLIDMIGESKYHYGTNLTKLNRKEIMFIKQGTVLLRTTKRPYKQIAIINEGDVCGEQQIADENELINFQLRQSMQYEAIVNSEQLLVYTIKLDELLPKLNQEDIKKFLQNKLKQRNQKIKDLQNYTVQENSEPEKPRLKLLILDEIEQNSTKAYKNQQKYFDNLKQLETKAFQQFQTIFQKMDQSFSRTKNYYCQRKLPTDKLFYQAFMTTSVKKQQCIRQSYRRTNTSSLRKSPTRISNNVESVSFCQRSKLFTRQYRSRSFNE